MLLLMWIFQSWKDSITSNGRRKDRREHVLKWHIQKSSVKQAEDSANMWSLRGEKKFKLKIN